MLLKKLRYLLEAAATYTVFAFFRLLPLDAASFLGGWIARAIGSRLPVSNIARRNLESAFPERSPEERERIVTGMWENLGRTFVEFPHLQGDALVRRVKVEGEEIFSQLQKSGKGSLFISAHYGNWELAARMVTAHDLPISLVYRPANNPYINKLICKIRGSFEQSSFAKGGGGDAFRMARMLQRGGYVGMLVDQKINEGIAVPFLGREAMTTPAVALLAMQFGVPVIPTRVVREKGTHFTVTFFPPMELTQSGDREADIKENTTRVNALIGDWVRERPEQWLWLHRRWPENAAAA